jgi:hypothetical protein
MLGNTLIHLHDSTNDEFIDSLVAAMAIDPLVPTAILLRYRLVL